MQLCRGSAWGHLTVLLHALQPRPSAVPFYRQWRLQSSLLYLFWRNETSKALGLAPGWRSGKKRGPAAVSPTAEPESQLCPDRKGGKPAPTHRGAEVASQRPAPRALPRCDPTPRMSESRVSDHSWNMR